LKTYRIKNQSVKLEENAATVMREFERSARAASKIITASDNEFTFYRYFDLTSPEPTQVRYFMVGGSFRVGLTPPHGVQPNITYPATDETIDLLIEDVRNTDLFQYFDGNSNQLSSPIDISEVRMANLKITLDKDPDKVPEAITETTSVSFRNLKDNL
jgi:hypothetical protein